MSTAPSLWLVSLTVGLCGPLLAACPDDDDDSAQVPILEPEPAGSPDEVADGLDLEGRSTLSCAGNNAPDPPSGATLTLPGWVRTFEDPTNEQCAQPSARAEVFDENDFSLGAADSDAVNGRVAVTIPIRETGFVGSVVVDAGADYLSQRFVSSRPVTGTALAGWVWLVTQDEVDGLADEAGVTLDSGKGIVVGAVHDCNGVGVAGAVVRWDGQTDGVVYLAGAGVPTPTRVSCSTTGPPLGLRDFGLGGGATFTDESGRFAVPNVDPGTITIEAFGRTEAGGPLELLSLADAEVTAGMVTAVDLEPRVGATR